MGMTFAEFWPNSRAVVLTLHVLDSWGLEAGRVWVLRGRGWGRAPIVKGGLPVKAVLTLCGGGRWEL